MDKIIYNTFSHLHTIGIDTHPAFSLALKRTGSVSEVGVVSHFHTSIWEPEREAELSYSQIMLTDSDAGDIIIVTSYICKMLS